SAPRARRRPRAGSPDPPPRGWWRTSAGRSRPRPAGTRSLISLPRQGTGQLFQRHPHPVDTVTAVLGDDVGMGSGGLATTPFTAREVRFSGRHAPRVGPDVRA